MLRLGYSVFAVLIWVLGASLPALAQTRAPQANTDVSATAESLFQEGKALMAEQQYTEACRKFEGSFALQEALGTLLNLAACHELEGKTASAWAEFLRAGAMARAESQAEREQVARERAQTLEPRLMRLKIVVPEAALVEGLAIRRDQVPVEMAAWGSAIPVDPGRHTVTVTAPGKQPSEAELELTTEGATVEFTIAPLQDEAPAAVAPVLPPPPAEPAKDSPPVRPLPATYDSDRGDTQRALGIIAGSVGAAGLAAGTVFGALASSKWDEAESEGCADGVCVTRAGQLASDDANQFAGYGTVGVIGGGALLVTGVVLYLTAPSRDGASSEAVASTGTSRWTLDVDPKRRSAGMSLMGEF